LDTEYLTFGQAYPDLDPQRLQWEPSRRLLEACHRHPDVDVVELGQAGFTDGSHADVIVVDCGDGRVPSRNIAGIKNRERLALVYRPSLHIPYEVRALRNGFPVTLHQDSVHAGEPPLLCLYFEPWAAVERSWTPQRHLERILWWLRETAVGTLHRGDQPLERLYFTTPYQIVLPPDFHERAADPGLVLGLGGGPNPGGQPKVIRGFFWPKGREQKDEAIFADSLTLTLPPVLHGPVERYPYTLSGLHDQLTARGSELICSLRKYIESSVPDDGIPAVQKDITLLVLSIPKIRDVGAQPEGTEVRGFCIHAGFVQLGVACGTLIHDKATNKAYVDRSAGLAHLAGMLDAYMEAWRELAVEPIDVALGVTREFALQASGIRPDAAQFQGVLAGVGALGGVLADLWSREAWGIWTYVDDDVIRAHNVVRHIAKDEHIGRSKAELVLESTRGNYFPGYASGSAIHSKLTDWSHVGLTEALQAASLLVDATTTLEVPREVATRDDMPRSASLFLTPSGLGSVLLLEDATRSTRLDALEAQYYRSILRQDWGRSHLTGHAGDMWVGAGCRDISSVLSNELVQLHGAMLARHLRMLSGEDTAQIQVWSLDDDTGGLNVHRIPVAPPLTESCGEWRIVWDEGLRERLFELRAIHLPSETGGILLGHHDLKLRTLDLVDVLPAPDDSEADRTGFTGGTQGLRETLDECAHQTANIVGYVGEWHSHPENASAYPSALDIELLAQLTAIMERDGLPELMLIVGEHDVGFSLGAVRPE